MKKISMILIISFILSLQSFCFAQNSPYSGEAIYKYLSGGFDIDNILNDDKYFKDITRLEFVTLLMLLDDTVFEKNQLDYSVFKDTNDMYVKKASAIGIIKGDVNNLFNPDKNISRQEIATIIYRYIKHKNIDTNSDVDLKSYLDYDDISQFALEPMSYCVKNEIITGFNDFLKPKENATVEQCMSIIYRVFRANNLIEGSEYKYINGFYIPSDTELISNVEQDNGITFLIMVQQINNQKKAVDDLKSSIKSKHEIEDLDDLIYKMMSMKVDSKLRFNIGKIELVASRSRNRIYVSVLYPKYTPVEE